MKKAKRPTKKDTLKTKAKGPANRELSEDQLDKVAGGAVDAFLQFEGSVGESTGSGGGTGKVSEIAINPATVFQYKP
jgi:hypothetical protein